MPILLLMFSWPMVSAAKKDTTGIAVISLEAKEGVSESIAELMSDILRTELYNSQRFTVMNREDMDVILKEIAFQQSGACDETACIVQMGQALGVTKMVAGSIGIIGNKYVINAKLINVETFTNEILVTEYLSVKSDAGPEKSFRSIAWQLAGLKKPKFKGLDEDKTFGLYLGVGNGFINFEASEKTSFSGTSGSTNYSLTPSIKELNKEGQYVIIGMRILPIKWLLLDVSWSPLAGIPRPTFFVDPSGDVTDPNAEISQIFYQPTINTFDISANWVKNLNRKFRFFVGPGIKVIWNLSPDSNSDRPSTGFSGGVNVSYFIQETRFTFIRPFVRTGLEVRTSPKFGFSIFAKLFPTKTEQSVIGTAQVHSGPDLIREELINLGKVVFPTFATDMALTVYF